jgi:hypothetical protein
MRREHCRVGGRLGARVHGNLEPARRGLEEELGCTPALGNGEEDALAVRSQGEQSVEAAVVEEVGDGSETVLVQRSAAGGERRDRSG